MAERHAVKIKCPAIGDIVLVHHESSLRAKDYLPFVKRILAGEKLGQHDYPRE